MVKLITAVKLKTELFPFSVTTNVLKKVIGKNLFLQANGFYGNYENINPYEQNVYCYGTLIQTTETDPNDQFLVKVIPLSENIYINLLNLSQPNFFLFKNNNNFFVNLTIKL